MSQTDQPSTDKEQRPLDAHIDARFQAVNARFIAVDGRFAATARRVDEVDLQVQTLARRFEGRFRSVDDRFDATRTEIDDVRQQLFTHIASRRLDVLVGVALCAVVNAVLCMGTIIVLS